MRYYRYRIAQEGPYFFPEWSMTKFDDWRRYPDPASANNLSFKSLEVARSFIGFRKALDDLEEPEGISFQPAYHE